MLLKTQKELTTAYPLVYEPIDLDVDYTIVKQVNNEMKKILLNNLIKLHQ